MHCNRCDTPNEPGSRYCRVCGSSFATATTPYVISNAPMAGPSCPACHRRNPEGARYCVFCATQLARHGPAAQIAPHSLMGGQPVAAVPALQPAGYTAAGSQPAVSVVTNVI